MQGKIVKGIAGFYYVDVIGSGVYECKAKGILRKENGKSLWWEIMPLLMSLTKRKRQGI